MRRAAAALALLWAVFAAAAALAAPACRDDRVALRGDWGSAVFTVELAATPQARARGLMHRRTLPRGSGMLFVYPRPQRVTFWMKNTLIPLDLVFADATGTVRHVHHMARPHDETPIPGGGPVRFVLEINGGLARDMGLTPGTQMRHPAVDADAAAWPC